MRLYAAIDLHSRSNYVGILDEGDKRVFKRKLPNDSQTILTALAPFQEALAGIVVESTFNWYWLVDLLMDQGYRVHLANPSAIKQYEGLKHSDDEHDAFWLAKLLKLAILPQGYIYPKEDRPVRDLLRKRGHLVRLRTSLILSLQNMISNNYGFSVNVGRIKKVREDQVTPIVADNENLEMSGAISKETIDFLTRKIRRIETFVQKQAKNSYRYLESIPGIGKVLSLTIALETGPIHRFPAVGNYVSYCRKVPTNWTSNGKSKGHGNKKNGNKYLAWAYSEAAEFARRYDATARSYYDRKAAKTNRMVAHSALAHKLSRAAFYIMRDQVAFDHQKLFV
jgi:transposase